MALDRPDLNGIRLQRPGRPEEVWLVDEGRRRRIPDRQTYDFLFRSWEGIRKEPHLERINWGDSFPSGTTRLFRIAGEPEVYLVYPYIKRWIASAETFDRWWFAWDEIVEIDPSDSQQMEKFEKLERGPDIE